MIQKEPRISTRQLKAMLLTCPDSHIVLGRMAEYLERRGRLSPEMRTKFFDAFRNLQLNDETILHILRVLDPETAMQLGGTGWGIATEIPRQATFDSRPFISNITNNIGSHGAVAHGGNALAGTSRGEVAQVLKFVLGVLVFVAGFAIYLDFLLAKQDTTRKVNVEENGQKDWVKFAMSCGSMTLPLVLQTARSFIESRFAFG